MLIGSPHLLGMLRYPWFRHLSAAAGIACSSAHSRSELRAEAAVLHGKKDWNYRFQLCESFYRNNQCSKGILCDDAHGIEEVRYVPALVHAPLLLNLLTVLPWLISLALPISL